MKRFFLLSLAFVAAFVVVLIRGRTALGWTGFAVFGLSAVGFAISFFSRRRLVMTREGFFAESRLGTARIIRWTEIENIGATSIGGHPAVGFSYVSGAKPKTTLRGLSGGLFGFEGCFFTQDYEMDADKIAEEMNCFWRRSQGGGGSPV